MRLWPMLPIIFSTSENSLVGNTWALAPTSMVYSYFDIRLWEAKLTPIAGIDMTPKGLEDVSKYPDLFKELLSRGVTDEQARKVAGENILRVWGDVEKVAQGMQKAGIEPLEDDLFGA
jgi:hypothetical protein